MSEEEFLARWSRRKREGRANAAPPESAEPGDASSTSPSPTANAGESEFDPSSLPSLDSITAATDITAFLRKGVPQELTHAALRRAWSADPAIRDFVGLAENAWDFNDPTAMPGFGPLDCSETELAALVDRIVSGVRKAAETLPDPAVDAENPADFAREQLQAETSTVAEVVDQSAATSPATVAAQPAVAEKIESELDPARRRTHGGALPR
ncbi:MULTISPECIES: DUF3306 domain-containing protein [Bradyrhizobium]|jgi:hypothetical protein|uniref:DUF3306 domain-containing protein n=1 Tax=Bradyrhizobium japonicum TaxID=375 RepID=A0ABV2RMT3_BRAJP|nr:DUF3306 domain-containing protein [Bradyrhizobium japonicum]KMK00286.1 hypothetical protein CF64_06515 [Bradyrhizobium japonicum]MBR0732621.1 DUF3306 domain-containing protein [Bradyrhizobium japonicum]MBR0763305.1 DUF3306 domain-containing protein [Bradyrhizobium japonicum]MBR0807292.1 DUF3306 domain-containing protein [Bradyrhizobium japonicum]MCP1762582.1 hypothetical protein [Bradyrhizobium japonicum]